MNDNDFGYYVTINNKPTADYFPYKDKDDDAPDLPANDSRRADPDKATATRRAWLAAWLAFISDNDGGPAYDRRDFAQWLALFLDE